MDNMELKTFVAETLKEILDGVIAAQEYALSKHAAVNPRGLRHVHDSPKRHYEVVDGEGNYHAPQVIEFDVAVTVSDTGKAKAGIGVFAAAIGVGTQAQLETENTAASRIKFCVPVLFPEQ